MTFVRLCACVLAFLCVLPGTARANAATPTITAFTNVNVVPMDRERVLTGQTVLVRDGTIIAIGRAVEIPAGARTIDGRGAWLSPGLADMHSHVDGANDLAVQLSLGVTTMLNMGEARNSFVGRTRAAVSRGDVPGPRIFAALAIDGSPQYGHLVVATAEDARATVQVAKANGYDFIKVYNNLSPEAFGAIVTAAAAAKIPIVGHGVTSVGLARQLEAGQVLVAHAEEFFYTFFATSDHADANAAPDVRDIPAAIALVRRHEAFVVADLVTYGAIARQWGRPEVVEQYLASPEAGYLAPGYRVSWASSGYARRSGSLDARRRFLDTFVHRMNAAGVHLLSGTDSPDIPGLVTGFALHENLLALEAAGLSRFDALATATRNPGIFIAGAHPQLPPFGNIAVGSRADLIVTAANPLDDLSTLSRPVGVMANGRWFPQLDLLALRERVSNAYRRAETSGGRTHD
jgi:imidazolonepropionase-like amidohydrolase